MIREENNEENSELNMTEELRSAELTAFEEIKEENEESCSMRYSHRQSSIYEPNGKILHSKNESRNDLLTNSEDDSSNF